MDNVARILSERRRVNQISLTRYPSCPAVASRTLHPLALQEHDLVILRPSFTFAWLSNATTEVTQNCSQRQGLS